MTHELAWATGLFEGEGYIVIHPKYQSVRIGMTQSDYDILVRLQNIFGGSIQTKSWKAMKPTQKPLWQWRLGRSEEVQRVLSQMLPLLGERRACKALDALDRLDGC